MSNNIREFRFNTGVKVYNFDPPVKCFSEYQIVGNNGCKIILFYCNDVPEDAYFMFACDNPKLFEKEVDNVIVQEIVSGGLSSKYAYFRLQNTNRYHGINQ